MKEEALFGTIYSCDAVAVVGTATQTNEIMRWVSLALTIVATIISIGLSVWKWWKMAKKDGKITEDEIEDLQHIFEDHKDKIKGKEEKKDE